MPEASIFDIYRGTGHDGPGLRTTVFFAGCPLSCEWCHNPEGVTAEKRVWWETRSCIGCGLCEAACENNAVRLGGDGIQISPEICTRCGACVEACPSKALAFTSREYGLDELIGEAIKDKPYYDKTGGGVTASGGECMLQSGFVAEFFKRLKSLGVTTAIDTCGLAPYGNFEKVLPYCNYILYDLKLMSSSIHGKYTGSPNGLILENLVKISGEIAAERLKAGLWIRTPLIPDITATEKNIMAIGKFIGRLPAEPSRWELCAFNNSCEAKYRRLNKSWPYADIPLISAGAAEALKKTAAQSGFPEEKIVISGILSE